MRVGCSFRIQDFVRSSVILGVPNLNLNAWLPLRPPPVDLELAGVLSTLYLSTETSGSELMPKTLFVTEMI